MLVAKFKPGERVYAISIANDIRKVPVECDVCNSTGEVKIEGREEDYCCPACHGEMEMTNRSCRYVVSFCGRVGAVFTEEYASKYKKSCKSEITYMLDETGVVGGGAIWKEWELFPTEEDANAFCDKYMPSDDGMPVLKPSDIC